MGRRISAGAESDDRFPHNPVKSQFKQFKTKQRTKSDRSNATKNQNGSDIGLYEDMTFEFFDY